MTARVARPIVIANSAFFIVSENHSAVVALKLTHAGRALLVRGEPRTATARLTSVSPTGRATTRSSMVTLIGKTRHR